LFLWKTPECGAARTDTRAEFLSASQSNSSWFAFLDGGEFLGCLVGPGIALGTSNLQRTCIRGDYGSFVFEFLLQSQSGLSVWKLFYLALIGAALGFCRGFCGLAHSQSKEKKERC